MLMIKQIKVQKMPSPGANFNDKINLCFNAFILIIQFNVHFSLVRCFPNNTFVAKAVAVYWSDFSVLQAVLNCMNETYQRFQSRNWKYFINLAGQYINPVMSGLTTVVDR